MVELILRQNYIHSFDYILYILLFGKHCIKVFFSESFFPILSNSDCYFNTLASHEGDNINICKAYTYWKLECVEFSGEILRVNLYQSIDQYILGVFLAV